MDIKNALNSIIRSHEKDVLKPLYTSWGENLDPEHVWKEYPRPQMVRSNYTILNNINKIYFIHTDTNESHKCNFFFGIVHIEQGDNRNNKDIHYENNYAKNIYYLGAHIHVFKHLAKHFGGVNNQKF